MSSPFLSPYQVLRVDPRADSVTLRAAYRRALREAHPDTGGDTTRFAEVQQAWALVGTPAARERYDKAVPSAPPSEGLARASGEPRPRRDSRPLARTYGHPGGWSREQYLVRLREWVGLGNPIADPYDPELVKAAPRAIRNLLASALAEEASARSLSTLGIGYTIWHDIETATVPLDHLVLGPTGLFAIRSADWNNTVQLRRNELAGEGVDRPLHTLAGQAKTVRRVARVKVTVLMVVVPDDALSEPLQLGGKLRGAAVAIARRSRLASAIRDGIPGTEQIGGADVMEVRSRLQATMRFAD